MKGWVRVVVVVAALKGIGAVGVLVAGDGQSTVPLVFSPYSYGLMIVAYLATGMVLLGARTRDQLAVWLACILMLAAAPFGETLLVCCSATTSLSRMARLLEPIPVVPLLPVFCWLFVRQFPSETTSPLAIRAAHVAIKASFLAAVLLIASNLSELLWPIGGGAAGGVQALLSRRVNESLYWPVIIAASLGALAFLAWKTQTARLVERRRVRVFVAGLLLGFLPVSVTVLLETASRAYAGFLRSSAAGDWIAQVVFFSLVAVPFVTAYSVMVDRVVEIRLVIRSALRYALAKYTLLAIMAIPLAGIGWYLYHHRDRTLLQLASEAGLVFLAATVASAGVVLGVRHRAFKALDRRFFREQYDARRILSDLAERCRKATTVDELVVLVCREIDRALHLDYVTVLLATPDGSVLRSPDDRIRPLSRSSGLAFLAQGDTTPLVVDLESADSTLRRLPEEERNWLGDSGFGLLVPLNAANGSLQGIIGLGNKLSELPFSREDRLLLEAIGTSVALTVENRRLRESASSSPRQGRSPAIQPSRVLDDGRPATECERCGRVYPSEAAVCDCGGDLEPALVPYVLAGKFHVDRRLGRGGMGVVYRALDMDLGRHVAIKTLPRIRPDDAARLRREAKAMATVQHENLAIIFGAETWLGTPILVVELLPGGTLTDRLEKGRLPYSHALDMGIALSHGVEHLHRAGVLHCDIKPSNVGFTRNGAPKLLDFGVATILRERFASGETTTRSAGAADRFEPPTPVEGNEEMPFAGTPRYMSPEAIAGEPPRPGFDLWSLTIVLFEAMAGTPPFAGASVAELASAIVLGDPPDIQRYDPTCPSTVARFFDRALSRRTSERPATAAHLRRELTRLRDDLKLG